MELNRAVRKPCRTCVCVGPTVISRASREELETRNILPTAAAANVSAKSKQLERQLIRSNLFHALNRYNVLNTTFAFLGTPPIVCVMCVICISCVMVWVRARQSPVA